MAVATSTAIAIGALALGAYQTRQQTIQQRKAVRKQERAQDVQENQQKASEAAQRRQKVRAERVRGAQIKQASSNLGVSGSSGESGAITALSTNTATSLAASAGATNTAVQLGNLNQQATRAQQVAGEHGAMANLAFGVSQFSASQIKKGS